MSEERAEGGVEEVLWAWLRPHAERDALIGVAAPLPLADAATAIAADNAAAVSGWIADGLLGKPSTAQLAAWNAEPARRFRMQIVQPYVLIQEITSEPEKENRHGG